VTPREQLIAALERRYDEMAGAAVDRGDLSGRQIKQLPGAREILREATETCLRALSDLGAVVLMPEDRCEGDVSSMYLSEFDGYYINALESEQS
jgi:hypothetical protein